MLQTSLVWGVLAAFAVAVEAWSSEPAPRQTVVVVVGAPGEPEYGQKFAEWSDRWSSAAHRAEARFIRIGGDEGTSSDRDRLRDALRGEQESSPETLWLVLIGHGTFDGHAAKFNLRGADVSAEELAEWLRPHTRQLVIINCASSSGPFIKALSAPGRVVMTATKSGLEHNFACFGDQVSAAIAADGADLDRDGQVSALEIFLAAARGVAEFYEREARLATEHPLLDDNGDALATPADWFQGVRATKRPQNAEEVDGRRARQIALVRSSAERELSAETRALRDRLELELERLRDRKSEFEEADYYNQLERILLQLAEIHRPAR